MTAKTRTHSAAFYPSDAIVSTQFFLELVFVVLGNFDKMGGMIFPSTFPTNG